MELPLDNRLSIGIQTIHRRTEPADDPWRPTIDEMQALVRLVDDCGYDSLWVGDHIAFAVSILDPLLQLAQAAVVSRRLLLGTNVYLLPLRHPVPVAKQVATLEADAAAMRRRHAHDRADGRGLAHAVAPEQGHHLAAANLEVDPEQDLALAVAGLEPLNGQHGGHQRGRHPLRRDRPRARRDGS